MPGPNDTPIPVERCKNCHKILELCLCDDIKPRKGSLEFLILQHPRETKNPFGTAAYLAGALSNSALRVGLSWSSFSKALGRTVVPSKWAVLYAGSLKESKQLKEDLAFLLLGAKGKPATKAKEIEGIVLLDGNWKQAKTLWWRNPWLLKLNRLVLNPKNRSEFGRVRKQPRGYFLSTIEAAAETLNSLGKDKESAKYLVELLNAHLDRLEAHRAK